MNKRHLDVRGLEAPEPLEKILGELDSLKNGQQLEVTHCCCCTRFSKRKAGSTAPNMMKKPAYT